MSVSILLEDDVDVSRGDMICRPHNQPTVANELDAMVCWMTDAPAAPSAGATCSSTPRARSRRWSTTCATASTSTRFTATRRPTELGLNEIGRVHLRTSAPLLLDPYDLSRTTGGFILIDETTYDTVGAGMVVQAGPEQQQVAVDEMVDSLNGETSEALEAAA